MQKALHITNIVLLGAFLLLPIMGHLLHYDTSASNLQNRRSVDLKQPDIGDFFDTAYWQKISDYVWDHLPFRDRLLKLDHTLDFVLFGDSPTPKDVILGKGDWAYPLTHVVDEPRYLNWEFDKMVKAFTSFEKAIKSKGKTLLLIMSPSQPSIYPEFITGPAADFFQDQFQTFYPRIRNAQQSIPSLLLMWEDFQKYRSYDSHPPVSKPTLNEQAKLIVSPRAIHYNFYGQALHDTLILHRLFPEYSPEQHIKEVDITSTGAVQAEVDRIWTKFNRLQPQYSDNRPQAKLIRGIPVSNSNLAVLVFHSAAMPPSPFTDKSVLIVHDSFLEKSLPQIATHFRETFAMHWSVIDFDIQLYNELARKADILIIQSRDGLWTNPYYRRYLKLEKMVNF